MPEERRVFSDNRRDELLNTEKWLNFLCIEGAEEEEEDVFRKLRLTSFNEGGAEVLRIQTKSFCLLSYQVYFAEIPWSILSRINLILYSSSPVTIKSLDH